jgi:ElaA protein
MSWTLKLFDELTSTEVYDILQLRSEVFVVEQTCAYQDIDNLDKIAYHLYFTEKNIIIAYARLLPAGVSYDTPAIGRVIVKQTHRKRNFGKQLMEKAKEEVLKLFGTDKITISAQMYLKKFYNEIGFKEIGSEYLEDDIPHIKMKSGF